MKPALSPKKDDGEDVRMPLEKFKQSHPEAVFVENVKASDVTAEAIAAVAGRANVHRYTRPGEAYVTAAEGFISVCALRDDSVEIDFGTVGDVIDFLSKEKVGVGPKLALPFRNGETRIFKVEGK